MKFNQESQTRCVIDMVTNRKGTNKELLRHSWLAVFEVPTIESKIKHLRELLPEHVFEHLLLTAARFLTDSETDMIPIFGGHDAVLSYRGDEYLAPENNVPKEFWLALAKYIQKA